MVNGFLLIGMISWKKNRGFQLNWHQSGFRAIELWEKNEKKNWIYKGFHLTVIFILFRQLLLDISSCSCHNKFLSLLVMLQIFELLSSVKVGIGTVSMSFESGK